jgi:hypothetical protein
VSLRPGVAPFLGNNPNWRAIPLETSGNSPTLEKVN